MQRLSLLLPGVQHRPPWLLQVVVMTLHIYGRYTVLETLALGLLNTKTQELHCNFVAAQVAQEGFHSLKGHTDSVS